jgi:predicted permease
MNDLRDALRSLRATPLVSAVAILSLALGIGANTAMFSIVDALVLRSLPVRNADRLALLSEGDAAFTSWTNPVWEAVRGRRELFDGAFAWGSQRFDLAEGGEVDPAEGLFASGRMFEVLGVDAVAGRTFTEADDRRGGGPDGAVAVISYGFWQRKFGGAADAVGRTIALTGVTYKIIGVTPPGFFGPEVGRTFDVIVPIGTEPLVRGKESTLDGRSTWWLRIMARLKPRQTSEQATAAIRAAQKGIADETRPTDWRPQEAAQYLTDPFTLRPAAAGVSGLRRRYEKPLLTIMAVVALTLLIACGNIANLLLARATARRHELSVRTALGASPWRLARQLLAESLAIGAIGAALGVAVAFWGSRLIVHQLAPPSAGAFLDIGIDWRMLAFTAAVAVGTALLFGIVPAFRATRVAPIEAMKEQGRGTSSGRRVGLGGALVMAQVALSLVLVIGAGLFVRTFASLAEVKLGFEREHVLVVTVGAQRTGVDSAARVAMYDRMRHAALAVPQVSQAVVSAVTPVGGIRWNLTMEFPGRPERPERERAILLNPVSPGFFATYGTPLVAGRDFDDRDRASAPRTAIVNQAFARKFFPGESPIGHVMVEAARPGQHPAPMEIVGIVGDAVYNSLRDSLPPTMYWPLAQLPQPPSVVSLSVRSTTASPALLSKSVGAAVTRVDSHVALTFRPLADQVNASLAQERLVAMLSGFFGALALLLAALGLYGMTSYSVNRRQVELGIRMALGTSPGGVVRLVLARVALLVGGGVLIGAVASWWAGKFVGTLLYGLTPRDPLTALGAVAVLAAVGTLAGWLPARRAAAIDPASVLREG